MLDNVVAYGNPAKIIRSNKDEWTWQILQREKRKHQGLR
jgi:hypothetical protein